MSRLQREKFADTEVAEKYNHDYTWKLGKIKNKYLILEIMAYSDSRDRASMKMFKTSKTLRVLIIRNRTA